MGLGLEVLWQLSFRISYFPRGYIRLSTTRICTYLYIVIPKFIQNKSAEYKYLLDTPCTLYIPPNGTALNVEHPLLKWGVKKTHSTCFLYYMTRTHITQVKVARWGTFSHNETLFDNIYHSFLNVNYVHIL